MKKEIDHNDEFASSEENYTSENYENQKNSFNIKIEY